MVVRLTVIVTPVARTVSELAVTELLASAFVAAVRT